MPKMLNLRMISIALGMTLGSSALAASLQSQPITVDFGTSDYTVKAISIGRIAADDSNKLLCQDPHYFTSFYWAPKSWNIDLKFTTKDGVSQGTIAPSQLHNKVCGASLVTQLKVTLHDAARGHDFLYDNYLYTQGNETVVTTVSCSYNDREPGSYSEWDLPYFYECTTVSTERFVGPTENFISVVIQ